MLTQFGVPCCVVFADPISHVIFDNYLFHCIIFYWMRCFFVMHVESWRRFEFCSVLNNFVLFLEIMLSLKSSFVIFMFLQVLGSSAWWNNFHCFKFCCSHCMCSWIFLLCNFINDNCGTIISRQFSNSNGMCTIKKENTCALSRAVTNDCYCCLNNQIICELLQVRILMTFKVVSAAQVQFTHFSVDVMQPSASKVQVTSTTSLTRSRIEEN